MGQEFRGANNMTHGKTKRAPTAHEVEAAAASADYVLEDQVGYILRCVHQRATDVFNTVMAPFGVTPMQFAALAKLNDLGTVSQNQLGRLIAMDPATISGVIGRLVARGYVRQTAHPDDARLAVLSLTQAGKAATVEMKAHAAEVSRRTLAPLSPTESAAFLSALGKLR